jgi:uncharacterized protein (DUF1330 family)
MIIQNEEILDKEILIEYAGQAKKIIESYGGKYLVSTEDIVPLSKNWQPRKVILIEFPSMKALEDCFGCEDYQAIVPLRMKAVKGKSIAVESL